MDIEKRVENLEKNFIKLLNKLDNNKFYTDADISGVRQNVSEVNQKLDESVYPDWDPKSYPYFAGERVSYNDEYYRCIQNHTSQADWAPDVAVSLLNRSVSARKPTSISALTANIFLWKRLMLSWDID